jgi:hypothetical protein
VTFLIHETGNRAIPDGHVNVYDGAKFALIDTIDFGEDSDPDNLRYDAVAKKI